jgi:phospholipase D1/2
MGRTNARRPWVWAGGAAGLIMAALALVVWRATGSLNPHEIAAWLAPHRDAWYALPAVMLAFVAFGLAMVPVLLLITVTGIAFGPLLGPVYAMAGCLASASTGFAIGRRVGWRRVEALGGDRIGRLARALKRHGTLAVYFVRKVPAPFTLVNIVIGASPVRYRDFMIGTSLGMVAAVVALAGFGYQFVEVLRDPTPEGLAKAALFGAVPLMLAWTINKALNRAAPAT